ncbi:MAG: zinc ABC transporter substrate-binding protein [Acidobacteria bacterium]|nr:zinc ABC transporter substrate-binding protein [Acidobacteriota bacterium]
MGEFYRESLKSARGKTFIFGGHAAFGYLAERYGLRQMSLYGLSPNARPKPKQMAGITDFARKNNVKVIFFEQFVSPELARVIADEVGAEIRVLYPGANRTAAQVRERVSFLQLMRMNLENLCHGLIRE